MNNRVAIKNYIFQKVMLDQYVLTAVKGAEIWNVDQDNFETHVVKVVLSLPSNKSNLELIDEKYLVGKEMSYKHEKLEVFATVSYLHMLTNNIIEVGILNFDCQ